MKIILQGGDNMLGRAIQLTLPNQSTGDENIQDSQPAYKYLTDIIPNKNVIDDIRKFNLDGGYLWGDVEFDLNEDLRIINLETAPTITVDESQFPQKTIHYHTNINNLDGVFRKYKNPYVLCMANNHVMDMGDTPFENETLPIMKSNWNTLGIGYNYDEASTPYETEKVCLFNFGCGCAGIPKDWSATETLSGVAYLPPIINDQNVAIAFDIISKKVSQYMKHEKKLLILSIHWGPNFSHANDNQVYRKKLAYKLVDILGIKIIHGHSSHHIRGVDYYKGSVIFYGCGDFVNDYEKIKSNYNTSGALWNIEIDDSTLKINSVSLKPYKMENLKVILMNDKYEISKMIEFINNQSRNDCDNPLIFKLL